MSTTLKGTCVDAEYEDAHEGTYERKPRYAIKPVFPLGVPEVDFTQAIQDFISIVGLDAVFIGEALSDYIDPYDIHEAEDGKRKVPSAAV